MFGFHALAFFSGPTRIVLAVFFGQGRSGVSFFFILSGFLLAWSARPGDTPGRFYRRRFARIYPSYLAVLGLAVLSRLLTDPTGLVFGLPTPLLLQAWFPSSDFYFAWNVPAWSLSVEAFFYLCFPPALHALHGLGERGLRITAVALAATVVTLGVVAGLTIPAAGLADDSVAVWLLFYFPVARLPEFLLGATCALLMRRGALPTVPVPVACALAGAAYLAAGVWPSAFGVSGECSLPLALLIVSMAQRDVRGTPGPLTGRVPVYLGTVSYCFYLVHHIFVLRLAQPGFVALGLGGWSGWVAAFGLGLLGAVVVHRYVEVPANRAIVGAGSPRTVSGAPR